MAFRTLTAAFAVSATFFSVASFAKPQVSHTPKNIIMVVGDGMGPAYTSAYRYYKDLDLSNGVDRTVLDNIYVGSASTYPAEESGIVTDSAAGATALATGFKSYNGAISVDTDRKPLNTVLRQAKRNGMRTGIAVTSQIVHATPAAYVTHNESRKNYNEIADHFFDDRINGEFVVDVMLGGGLSYFERDDRDLVAEFIDAGYQYTDSYNKLATYSEGQSLLGLFAPIGLPWALDDKRPHRLSYMAEHAIKHLENENGFFLLIEASQVDWAGHANDIASAMAEMDDLAKTIEFLTGYVEKNPDTLVVLTADHSTGGLTIGANSDYKWEPEWIRNLQSSVTQIAEKLVDETMPAEFVSEQLGFELNSDEKLQMTRLAKIEELRDREAGIKKIIDIKTNTGWTTGGHTGVDVPVFSMGQGSHLFAGSIDNTEIAKTIFSFLNSKPNDRKKIKSNKDKEEACNFKTSWVC
ncbi:alkaline phosphatase [Alteromonas sp. 5E99-2]|uniref:alkaline phosphatase n=1 Tax=Alteromonas sp. 5E99-2 TaxID=2817683 RepID=UPI001A991574|nr:alkaline phosphatase [Alteromonas sp. 5E99-2]MBO1256524.1 alkaline phosphatase [Alteromonas sp. 5E99-2]